MLRGRSSGLAIPFFSSFLYGVKQPEAGTQRQKDSDSNQREQLEQFADGGFHGVQAVRIGGRTP